MQVSKGTRIFGGVAVGVAALVALIHYSQHTQREVSGAARCGEPNAPLRRRASQPCHFKAPRHRQSAAIASPVAPSSATRQGCALALPAPVHAGYARRPAPRRGPLPAAPARAAAAGARAAAGGAAAAVAARGLAGCAVWQQRPWLCRSHLARRPGAPATPHPPASVQHGRRAAVCVRPLRAYVLVRDTVVCADETATEQAHVTPAGWHVQPDLDCPVRHIAPFCAETVRIANGHSLGALQSGPC